MKFTLERFSYGIKSTQGQLLVDGAPQCYTLELPYTDGKPGSAIPEGTYPVTVYPSPKFGRLMPLIIGIPGRSQIELHWGNTPADTDGCVLLGKTTSADFIGESREAFDEFWAKVQGALEAGGVTITIKRSFETT